MTEILRDRTSDILFIEAPLDERVLNNPVPVAVVERVVAHLYHNKVTGEVNMPATLLSGILDELTMYNEPFCFEIGDPVELQYTDGEYFTAIIETITGLVINLDTDRDNTKTVADRRVLMLKAGDDIPMILVGTTPDVDTTTWGYEGEKKATWQENSVRGIPIGTVITVEYDVRVDTDFRLTSRFDAVWSAAQ